LIALGHGFASRFDGCSIADGDKPVRQGQARPSRRFGSGSPDLRSRGGPCGVFIGELEKTIAQIRVGGIAGEAATLGLLVKV
jgi:hypothetical protein